MLMLVESEHRFVSLNPDSSLRHRQMFGTCRLDPSDTILDSPDKQDCKSDHIRQKAAALHHAG